MSRKTVAVEVLNAHGEWEVLVEGSEEFVYGALMVAKRVLDIGLQMKMVGATCSPATWIGRDKK